MKKIFLVGLLLMLLAPMGMSAQDTDVGKKEFSRGSSLIIRPELYSGLFVEVGYQFNPYLQTSGGVGFGLDGIGGAMLTLGVRAYATQTKWTPFVDYHIGSFNYLGYNFIRHTIVGGVSFKNLDLGAGFMNLTDGYDSALGLSITLGYNIRTNSSMRNK